MLYKSHQERNKIKPYKYTKTYLKQYNIPKINQKDTVQMGTIKKIKKEWDPKMTPDRG